MSAARWADAAFEQERLLHALRAKWELRRFFEGWQASAYPDLPEGVLIALHEYLLAEADPMYVSDDVVTLWDRARESFQPEVLHAWDLPCPVGFALLPRALRVTDASGRLCAFRAVLWSPISATEVGWSDTTPPEGVWVTLLSHRDDKDDLHDGADMGWDAVGPWAILHSGALPFERYEAWVVDDGPTMFGEPGVQKQAAIENWLLVQSFWRLSRQLVPVKEPLPRQLRRERKRHGRSDDVTVIRLRRPKGTYPDDHVPGVVDWQHQWVVQGHWRQQWYPSLKQHRQVWISPYVKGPEDKPLKLPKRAFEFTR